MKRTYLRA